MYLLDTNIVSYAMKRHRLADLYEDVLLSRQPLFIALQTVGEMLFGALDAKWGDRRMRDLEFTISKYRLYEPDRETAEYYGTLMSISKSIGRQLSAQDCWIAATAAQNDLTLVSHDKDYPEELGIRVIRRKDPPPR